MLIMMYLFLLNFNPNLKFRIEKACTESTEESYQINELKKLLKDAKIYTDTLGLIYYRIGFRYHKESHSSNLDSAIVYLEKANKLLSTKDCEGKYFNVLLKLSECYNLKKNYEKQLHYLLKAIYISDDNKNSILQNTDEVLSPTNSYQVILDVLKLHEKYLMEKINLKEGDLSELYTILSRNYLRQGIIVDKIEYREAINILEQNINFISGIPNQYLNSDLKTHLANSYNNLGSLYLIASEKEKALNAYINALSFSLLSDMHIVVLRNLVLFHLNEGNIKEANSYFTKIQSQNNKVDKNNKLGIDYYNFRKAKLFKYNKNYPKALEYLNESENVLYDKHKIKLQNRVEKSYIIGNELRFLFAILNEKIDILSIEKHKNKNEILKILSDYSNIVDAVRLHQTEEASKLIFKDNIKVFYNISIKLLIDLGENRLALHYLEKSKSALLLDNIENKFKDKVLVEFHYIVKSISSKTTFDSIQFMEAYAYIPKILELVKEKLYTKKDTIENNINSKNILNFTNSRLDHIFISYFLVGTKLFAFKVTNKIELLSWTINPNLESYVNEYTSNITNKKDLCLSYILYEALIKPLGKLPKNITIIPHSYLAKLPFETLTTEPIQNEKKLKNAKYLIYDHNIDYQYSLVMSSVMKQKKSTKKQSHLYLPDFGYINEIASNNRDEQLAPLLFAKKEVEEIEKYIPSKIFKDKNANKENFINSLSQSSLLHFSGHAIINAEDHNLSYLAFDNTEKNRLYLKDLMGNNSNADLVVLSACETGYGKEGAGEGLLSLGRALVTCGTKSIVTSLWNVNDQTGMKIVSSFYKNLKAGRTKPDALRNSKLDFLKNSNSNTNLHPYYWSAFIFIGDEEVLKFETENYIIYYSLGFFLLLTLLIIYYFKRRKRNFN